MPVTARVIHSISKEVTETVSFKDCIVLWLKVLKIEVLSFCLLIPFLVKRSIALNLIHSAESIKACIYPRLKSCLSS